MEGWSEGEIRNKELMAPQQFPFAAKKLKIEDLEIFSS